MSPVSSLAEKVMIFRIGSRRSWAATLAKLSSSDFFFISSSPWQKNHRPLLYNSLISSFIKLIIVTSAVNISQVALIRAIVTYKKDAKFIPLQKKRESLSSCHSDIRLSADITDPFFIDRTDAVPITARGAFREIRFHRLGSYRLSAVAAVSASIKILPTALRAEDGSKDLTTMRALHLFLLDMKTLYKTINIPFISP